MKQWMETFEHMRQEISINAMGEEVKHYRRIGKIQAAVSTITGSTKEQNQALRISSTHRGLTQYDVRTGDKIGDYIVDFVISNTRYTQLYLTKEETL